MCAHTDHEDTLLDLLRQGRALTVHKVARDTHTDLAQARAIMTSFAKNHDTLSVTYYVSGLLKANGGIAATLVPESGLRDFKNTLETVLSEQIYAIYNTSSDVDPSLLQIAHDNYAGELCEGAITLESLVKNNVSAMRTASYPEQLRQSNDPPKVPAVQSKKGPPSLFKHFKSEEKPKETESKVTSPKKTSPKKEPIKKNGIAGFFSKGVSNGSIKNSKESDKPASSDVKKEDKKETVSPVKTPIRVEKPKTKPKKGSEKKSSSKNSTKKRKRIVCEDSDSDEDKDDIFEPSSPKNSKRPLSDEDEDVIPQTPEVSEPKKTVLNSRKRKKIVDKTFMQGDFFVTVKEEVFESCSDEEIENEVQNSVPNGKNIKESPKKSEPEKPKKSAPAVVKGKQSNLMSFFKRDSK